MTQIIEHFGAERRVSVSREITKKFEENVRGTATEVMQHFTDKKAKGEIVLCVEGKEKVKKEKSNKYV